MHPVKQEVSLWNLGKNKMEEALRPIKLGFHSESIGGIRIGQAILSNNPSYMWTPTPATLSLVDALNDNSQRSEGLRRSITFNLGNNTSSNRFSAIRHDRPVSAYYTYNPEDETVIVEWGTIDPKNKEAKLHSYLNKSIDFFTRRGLGMRISSGHLAKLSKTNEYLALFDNLTHQPTERKPDDQIRRTIDILYQNSIIPITADGFVQLPLR